jgi:hypothetical protein
MQNRELPYLVEINKSNKKIKFEKAVNNVELTKR